MTERTVGIREMNQNAGRLIREVNRTGGSILITDRGEPVAVLGPAPSVRRSTFDRLARDGKVARATCRIDDVPGSQWTLHEGPLEVLAELRADR